MASTSLFIIIWSITTFSILSTKGWVNSLETGVRLTRQPQDVVSFRGQSAWLNCSASSSQGPLRYSWIKDGEAVGGLSRRYALSGEGGSLQLLGLVKKHEGAYRCLAQNSVGVVLSREATVRVVYTSRFRVDVAPEVVYEGDSAVLACSVRDLPPPPDYTWLRDGQPLTANERFTVLKSGVLRITDAQIADNGDYSCVMGAPGNQETAHAQLTVMAAAPGTRAQEDAFLLVQPDNASYLSNADAVLECLAGGYPKPEVTWVKGGLVLNEGYIVRPTGNLIIPNVEEADSGLYTCEASNSAHVATASALLTVTDPPRLIEKSENLMRPTSATLRLWCYFNGSSPLRVSWFHNGEPLVARERVKFQPDGTVVVSQSQPHDSGYYQCIGQNGGGEATGIIRLYVQPPQEGAPDPPVDISLAGVTFSSITLQWTPAPEINGEGAFAYSIHYRPASGGAELQQVVVNGTRATVEHLQSGTMYTFYLLAYNGKGSSEQSQRVTLATSPPGGAIITPAPDMADTNPDTLQPPSHVQGRSLNATAILVGWEPPLATGGHQDAALSYVVRFKLQDDARAVLGISEPDIKFHVSSTELILKELLPNSLYRIDVCSKRGDKESAYSTPALRITTLEAAPSEPLEVEVHVLSDGSAHVAWKAPRQPNGVIRYYVIHYTTRPDAPLAQWTSVQQNGLSSNTVVTGLAPSQVYYFRLTAETSAGAGPPSSQRTIQTTTSSADSNTGPFVGASDRDKGIILGVCIGGFCIIVCIVIVLLRNRCISQGMHTGHHHLDHSCTPGKPNNHSTPRRPDNNSFQHHGNQQSYTEMDSLQPMLPPVPVNAHCDTKGGYDTYPGRYTVTRLAGMNGFSGGRTRTVSSGYTSDRDLDDALHLVATSEGEPTDRMSVDVARLDELEGVDSCSLTSPPPPRAWIDSGSLQGSLAGSRDSNKDSGTGTECALGRGGDGSESTLTAPSSSDTSPQRSGSSGFLPSSGEGVTVEMDDENGTRDTHGCTTTSKGEPLLQPHPGTQANRQPTTTATSQVYKQPHTQANTQAITQPHTEPHTTSHTQANSRRHGTSHNAPSYPHQPATDSPYQRGDAHKQRAYKQDNGRVRVHGNKAANKSKTKDNALALAANNHTRPKARDISRDDSPAVC